MADRLTQLQEAVTQMSEHFCNSIGILQQTSTNTEDKEGISNTENDTSLFASLITQTARDIETLIDSLPSQEYTPDKQAETLQRLELENKQSALKLNQVVKEAETLLKQVRQTNEYISKQLFKLDTSNSEPMSK